MGPESLTPRCLGGDTEPGAELLIRGTFINKISNYRIQSIEMSFIKPDMKTLIHIRNNKNNNKTV